jgi:hypothetical protein
LRFIKANKAVQGSAACPVDGILVFSNKFLNNFFVGLPKIQSVEHTRVTESIQTQTILKLERLCS